MTVYPGEPPYLYVCGRDADGGAYLSPDRVYRYSLTRRFVPVGVPHFGGPRPPPLLTFVLINPSTADEVEDDPTVRRCLGFAKREGAAGIRLLNLYAYRTKDPSKLRALGVKDAGDLPWRSAGPDPVGPSNNDFLQWGVPSEERVIVGWGASIACPARVAYVAELLQTIPRNLWCLGRTKSGEPRHPLYLRADAPLEEWTPTAVHHDALRQLRERRTDPSVTRG